MSACERLLNESASHTVAAPLLMPGSMSSGVAWPCRWRWVAGRQRGSKIDITPAYLLEVAGKIIESPMGSMWDLDLRPDADCDWRWVVCPPPAAKMLDRYDCCVPEVHVGKLYWRANPADSTEHIVEILTSASRAVWPDELCFIAGYDLVEGFNWQQYVYSPGAIVGFPDAAGWSSEAVCAWKPAADWIMQMQGDVDDLNDVYSFANHTAPGEVHAARQHGHLQFCQGPNSTTRAPWNSSSSLKQNYRRHGISCVKPASLPK